jgi:hypothetical protein
LECGRSIGEAKVHDQKVEGAISGSEGSFPFVTWSDMDKVVCASKVDLGEDTQVVEAIEEVWDERKGIVISFGDSIEAMPINAEAE